MKRWQLRRPFRWSAEQWVYSRDSQSLAGLRSSTMLLSFYSLSDLKRVEWQGSSMPNVQLTFRRWDVLSPNILHFVVKYLQYMDNPCLSRCAWNKSYCSFLPGPQIIFAAHYPFSWIILTHLIILIDPFRVIQSKLWIWFIESSGRWGSLVGKAVRHSLHRSRSWVE